MKGRFIVALAAASLLALKALMAASPAQAGWLANGDVPSGILLTMAAPQPERGKGEAPPPKASGQTGGAVAPAPGLEKPVVTTPPPDEAEMKKRQEMLNKVNLGPPPRPDAPQQPVTPPPKGTETPAPERR
jgi:hypothetical protein